MLWRALASERTPAKETLQEILERRCKEATWAP